MCDEYDDERMRAFWRLLAEQKGLVPLDVVEPEGDPRADVLQLTGPATPAKPRAAALRR